MTLHEAIRHVLIKHRTSKSTSELAKIINDENLYSRRDLQAVTASQIMSRIDNYKDLFIKSGNMISLRGYDDLEIFEEEIQKKIWHFLKENSRHQSFDNYVFFEVIFKLIIKLDKYSNITSSEEFKNVIIKNLESNKTWSFNYIYQSYTDFLTSLIMDIISFPDRKRIILSLTEWFSREIGKNEPIKAPSYLGKIFGDLKIYDRDTTLHTSLNMLNDFIIPIYKENPKINFNHNFLKLWKNSRVEKLNSLILKACNIDPEDSYNFNDSNNIALITPPWGIRSKGSNWSSNFLFLEEYYEFKNINLNKAILLVPESALFSGGKDSDAREYITRCKHLDAIFTIPFTAGYTGIKSAALIFLDFKKENNSILIADFILNENFDIENNWQTISETYNNKQILKGISKFIYYDDIYNTNFDWTPKRFLLDPESFPLKLNYSVFKLKDILVNWKRGKNVNRSLLYEDGELKFFRIRDLELDGTILKPNPMNSLHN